MARPPSPNPTKPLKIQVTPKLWAYLIDLVHEEGYGNSRAEVALGLVWQGVERLIADGVLERKKGRFTGGFADDDPQ